MAYWVDGYFDLKPRKAVAYEYKKWWYFYILIFLLLTIQYSEGALAIVPLETEHLYLRAVERTDVHDIAAVALNSQVIKTTALFPQMDTVEEVQNFIVTYLLGDSGQHTAPRYPLTWAIVEKKSMRVIGLVVFCSYSECHQRAELAYVLSSDYWNCGYTTQACQAIVEYALAHGVFRIQATVDPENKASERVLQKLKMSFEGVLRSYMIVHGVVNAGIERCMRLYGRFCWLVSDVKSGYRHNQNSSCVCSIFSC